jgi:hypothetical protein
VDNGTETCAHGTGHSSGNLYDLHVQLTYSGSWQIHARQCSESSWGGFSSVGSVAAVNIVEFSVPLTTFGSTSDVSFFARYGTTTDYAPDSDPATLIELASFTATQADGGVRVEWQTVSEVDNAGFNLYRSEAADDEYVKLNGALIPAQGDPAQGAMYSYDDIDVVPGTTYFYKLEDVDLHGVSTFHGPVSVDLGEMPTSVDVLGFTASGASALAPLAALALGAGGLAWTWRRKRR